jgi:hypothetical protein
MYRVGMSQSVGDVKLAIAINKYIETMCCIFTMIVSGINPIAKSNDDIKGIIKKISAEGIGPKNISAKNINISDKIRISAEDIDPRNISVEYMNILDRMKCLSTDYDIGFNETKPLPRIGKNAVSTEGIVLYKKTVSKWHVDGKFSEKLDKYPAYPTILKITFTIGSGEVVVPVAVKASPQAIGSEEMKMFIESVLSGRSFKFIRYFKWKSGEINTLEYLLGTDIAKRDKKLYQSLGRNPLYIEFMKRKAQSKVFGALDSLVSSKGNAIGPTGSLVVTTDDLVAATKLDIRRFTRNDEFIQRIMQETFIMSFAIVDIGMEIVSFYFMGYKEPFRMNFADLGVGVNVNSDKQLEQAILELSRKVA